MVLAKDVDQLSLSLQVLQDTLKNDNLKTSLKGLILSGDNNIEGTPFASYAGQGITSLSGVRSWLERNMPKQYLDTFDAWLDKQAEQILNFGDSLGVVTDELAPLMTQIDNLYKAKDALELLNHPDGKNAKEVAEAWNTLLTIFPDLKAETVTIEAVQTKIDDLDGSIKEAAASSGELGASIVAAMTEGAQSIKYLSKEMQDSFLATASQEGIASYINKFFGGGNVDWTKRKRVGYQEMLEYGWDLKKTNKVDPENLLYATKFGSSVGVNVGGKDYVINVTPILPDGQVLTPAGLDAYVEELTSKAENLNISLFDADKTENGGKGILYYVAEVTESTEEAQKEAEDAATAFDLMLSAALNAYDSRNLSAIGKGIVEDIEDAK